MNNSGRGGGIIGGIIGLIVVIGGLFAVHRFLPALFLVVLWIVLGLVIAVIGLIIVLIILANKSGKEKDQRTAVGGASENLSDEQNEILIEARKKLMELRRAIMPLRNVDIRLKANKVCDILEKITRTLKEKPEKIKGSRQCLNYYIPTIKDVMTNFVDLEKKGQLSEDMVKKAGVFLSDVQEALEKKYNDLFDADKIGMEVDMEAMTIAIQRDGLLEKK